MFGVLPTSPERKLGLIISRRNTLVRPAMKNRASRFRSNTPGVYPPLGQFDI